MENFANFIVNYIETKKIHGIKGWYNQLLAYQWDTGNGIEHYPDGISTSKKFFNESNRVLNCPSNDKMWCLLCDDIRNWGGMNAVPSDFACSLKKSVNFLLKNNPGIDSDFTKLPINGERIATASKIYYYSDPLRWTIYDSRVGFALHQLIFEYATEKGVTPSSLFQEIPLCLPDSPTQLPNSKIKKRKPIFSMQLCGSETRSKASFIWTSYLHRLLAIKLNEMPIQKPTQCLSKIPQWELPHVEMIFFVIGDHQWIEVSNGSTQETLQIQS